MESRGGPREGFESFDQERFRRMLIAGVSNSDVIKRAFDYRAHSVTLNKFRLHICKALDKEK